MCAVGPTLLLATLGVRIPLLSQARATLGATGAREPAADLYSKGTNMLNRGALHEAMSMFDAAVKASAAAPAPHLLVNRALTLARLGRPEDALAGYDAALRVLPQHTYALYNRGLVLRALHRPAEAASGLEKAIAAQPTNSDAYHDHCAALFESRGADDLITPALRALMERALVSCDRAAELDPTHAFAFATRGLVLGTLQVRV